MAAPGAIFLWVAKLQVKVITCQLIVNPKIGIRLTFACIFESITSEDHLFFVSQDTLGEIMEMFDPQGPLLPRVLPTHV